MPAHLAHGWSIRQGGDEPHSLGCPASLGCLIRIAAPAAATIGCPQTEPCPLPGFPLGLPALPSNAAAVCSCVLTVL